MSKISFVGIDIAKLSFQLHGIDGQGHTRLSKNVVRTQLLKQLSKLPPCRVAMEACCGSHYWARQIQTLGHEVQLIPPQEVKPFVKVHKNDRRDAQAIAECAARPATSSVTIKSETQLDIQALHRVRERLIKERTAIGNELRGILAERGYVMRKGAKALRERVMELSSSPDRLSDLCRTLMLDLFEQWCERDRAIERYDKQLKHIGKQDEHCRRLQTVPGIGIINATLLRCYAGNAAQYKSGRHFSASLGLVPRQRSTGEKQLLLGISKRGNKSVRKQLVHGARAAYRKLLKMPPDTRLAKWVQSLATRMHPNKVVVALANKLARIAWAIIRKDAVFTA